MINDAFNLLKIGVPVVLIIMGMIDLVKAVAGQKEEDIKKVIAIIKEYNYLDKVIFISFYIENLEIVKRYLPNQRAQFLSSKYDETVLDLLIKYNVDFDVHHSALNKRIVDELHHKGIKVNCWTVNEKKRDPYHK